MLAAALLIVLLSKPATGWSEDKDREEAGLRYLETIMTLNEYYYKPLNLEPDLSATLETVPSALEKVFEQVDSDTMLMSAEELAWFDQAASEEIVGIGAELEKPRRQLPLVIFPLAGSPAARVGLRAGDQLMAVDGADTVPLTMYGLV